MDMSCGLLLLTGISWLYYDTFLAVFFLSPLLIIWHRECRAARRKKEKEQFLKMFREWILFAGIVFIGRIFCGKCICKIQKRAGTHVSKGWNHVDELEEMIRKAGNNQRPEQLLEELAEKHPYEEVKSFVEVFCTARGSGGSLNGIIRKTSAQMAEIMDTRREIDTFLAAKIYEQRIMMVMPAGVLLYIRLGSGEFIADLYHNLAGICVMTGCLLVYLGACVLGRRMVQFDI